MLDRTLVIVAGDHGESLGDHGEDGHGILLYQSTLHVPFIMRVPGLAPGRVADVTRLVDMMPTVLDFLHVPAPSMDGASLIALMTGRVKHLDLDAYAESAYPRRFGWSDLQALRAGRYKFINAPRPELDDLDVDPGERHDIFHERAALGSVMAARLDALTQSAAMRDPMESAVDAETASRLAALGYVSHGAVGVPRAGPEEARAIDPKDCIERYNEIVRRRRDSAPELATPANAGNKKCGAVASLAIRKDSAPGSSGALR